MPESVDRLFVHCRELLPLTEGPPTGSRRGESMQRLDVVEDGAIAVRDGRIVATGTTQDIQGRYESRDVVDLSDYVVMPGFVDCHTHPVFASTREGEFHMRCAGADYMAIAQAGGGILRSVRSVHEATDEHLRQMVRKHYDGFLAHGTTTIEAKSGYGLTTETEVKSLDALGAVACEHPLTVSRTFLGAHEVPPDFRDRRDAYVDLVIEEMMPAVKGKCTSCDVFAEPKVFDRKQSERILRAAIDHGMRLRIHADEIEPMGGAELAVELGADSADHLPRISLAGQDALASSATTAVLLPGTSFYLGKQAHAPARSMIEKGCAVALATDFNPGSCYTQSIPLIITLACVLLHMSVEECVHAVTINPAASLHLDEEIGTLHVGKRADFVALDLPSHRALGYAFGGNPVVMTVKDGEPVVTNVTERGYDTE
ncbi:MAG: imidazolonepropionase [Planctomycetes bacterium]|nr:imidazolonepropionase [Planctomycetota bacterium]